MKNTIFKQGRRLHVSPQSRDPLCASGTLRLKRGTSRWLQAGQGCETCLRPRLSGELVGGSARGAMSSTAFESTGCLELILRELFQIASERIMPFVCTTTCKCRWLNVALVVLFRARQKVFRIILVAVEGFDILMLPTILHPVIKILIVNLPLSLVVIYTECLLGKRCAMITLQDTHWPQASLGSADVERAPAVGPVKE